MASQRHDFDPEIARENFEWDRDQIQEKIQASLERTDRLYALMAQARAIAGNGLVLGAPQAEIRDALHVAVDAAVAIMRLASESGTVTYRIGDRTTSQAATGPSSVANAPNWVNGFYLALILRDADAVDALTATPAEVLRASSTRSDDYLHLWVDTLRRFGRKEPGVVEKLEEALEATEPSRVTVTDIDAALRLVVPEMRLLFHLLEEESGAFEEALRHALAQHARWWSRKDRRQDPEGFLAAGPLAFTGAAKAIGLEVNVSSDYLPEFLLS